MAWTLKNLVILKGKDASILKDLNNIPVIFIRFSPKGWMNHSLMIEYLLWVIGTFSFVRYLMVWDAYWCHVSQTMKMNTKEFVPQHYHYLVSATKFWTALSQQMVSVSIHLPLHTCTWCLWLALPTPMRFERAWNWALTRHLCRGVAHHILNKHSHQAKPVTIIIKHSSHFNTLCMKAISK